MKRLYFTITFLALMLLQGVNLNGISASIPENGSTLVHVNDKVTLNQAAITAQDYVKQHFFFKCKFNDWDIRGEEMSVRNRFNVLQKFTCKKDGVERQYVYKCILQYKGGDWTDTSNWDFSTLIVEDMNTGRQWKYYGNLR